MLGLYDIPNFVSIDKGLACSGQPLPGHFPLLAREGFKAVINLATSASSGHLPEEAGLCAEAGLDFTWRPVSWDAPTIEDYRAFEAWLDANRGRKVLVHCAKNWRASLFCAVYRVVNEGLDPMTARDAVLEVWEPDAVWTGLARQVLTLSCELSGDDPAFIF